MSPPAFPIRRILAVAWLACGLAHASEDALRKHRDGSEQLAVAQDELSADVQQLVMEQTIQPVIDLLAEVQDIMAEATDHLIEHETGGTTLAAQTEVIEKIHEAAKERRKQSGGGGEAGGAMMDMLERMMGKQPGPGEGQGQGESEGQGQGGESGGNGQTGASDAANSHESGESREFSEERRVPKAAGSAGRALPSEFRPALEAYNRGLESLPPPAPTR